MMIVLVVWGEVLLCSVNTIITKENTMKKIPILLALIALGAGDLTGTVLAADELGVQGDVGSSEISIGEAIEANQVLEPALVLMATSVAGNRLTYKFMGAENNLGLWQFYVADYDVWHYSQRMVEENLELLGSGEKPFWAREMVDLSIQWKNGDLGPQPTSLGVANHLVGNNPGVLYYAAQIRDNSDGVDNPSYRWVRGKLDYRMCAYSSRNLPHIAKSCQVRVDTEAGEYVFEQKTGVVRDETDPYQTWAEEFTVSSRNNLNYWRNQIKGWTGDKAEKEEILLALQGAKNTAEDTAAEADILALVAECEELLREKMAVYEPEVSNPEVDDGDDDGDDTSDAGDGSGGIDGGVEGSDKDETDADLGPSQPGESGASNSGVVQPVQSVVITEEAKEIVTEKPVEAAVSTNFGDKAVDRENASEGVFEASKNENVVAQAEQKVDLAQDRNEPTEIEVPKLSENRHKWGISILLGGGFMMMIVGLGLIRWLRRRK